MHSACYMDIPCCGGHDHGFCTMQIVMHHAAALCKSAARCSRTGQSSAGQTACPFYGTHMQMLHTSTKGTASLAAGASGNHPKHRSMVKKQRQSPQQKPPHPTTSKRQPHISVKHSSSHLSGLSAVIPSATATTQSLAIHLCGQLRSTRSQDVQSISLYCWLCASMAQWSANSCHAYLLHEHYQSCVKVPPPCYPSATIITVGCCRPLVRHPPCHSRQVLG
jgi:hypothetical protein